MLLISCAAVPESIVKLRAGQDVAGVAVSLVGQDKTGFSLLDLDILVVLFDDVAENLCVKLRFRRGCRLSRQVRGTRTRQGHQETADFSSNNREEGQR